MVPHSQDEINLNMNKHPPAQQVQVPSHVLRVFSDEAGQEKVEIQVDLPGVSKASEISVRIEPPDTVQVSVSQRYQLLLKLSVPVAARADTVRFKSRSSRLTMSCLVVSPAEAAALRAAAAAEADAGAQDAKTGAAIDQPPTPAAAQQAPAAHQASAPQQRQAGAAQPAAAAGAETQTAAPQAAATSCGTLQLPPQSHGPVFMPGASTPGQQQQQPGPAFRFMSQPERPTGAAVADYLTEQCLRAGFAGNADSLQQAMRQAFCTPSVPLVALSTTTGSRAGSSGVAAPGPAIPSSTSTTSTASTASSSSSTSGGSSSNAGSSGGSSTSSSSSNAAVSEDQLEHLLGTVAGVFEDARLVQRFADGAAAQWTDSAEHVAGVLELKWGQAAGHAPSLVGWWCSLLDFASYWLLFCCLHAACWADLLQSSWARFAAVQLPLQRKYLYHVVCLPYYAFCLPKALLNLAWALAYAVWFTVLQEWLSLTGQHQRRSALPAEAAASGRYLASAEAARPAAIKLLLASCTGALVWLLLRMLWALVCGVWWLLCWPWLRLVWSPNMNMQMALLGFTSVQCRREASIGYCNAALMLLQAAMSGGHLMTVGSFLVSFLWLHYATHRRSSSSSTGTQPAGHSGWLQAAKVGLAYPVARTWLGRAGAVWLLELPNYVVAAAAWGAFELCWGLAGWCLGLAATPAWQLLQKLLMWSIECLGTAALLTYSFDVDVLGPRAESSTRRHFAWASAPVVVLTVIMHLLRAPSSRYCVMWVVQCVCSLIAWIWKPWVLLPSSLLWYDMLLLVPLPLLERMSLLFCGAQSGSTVMRKASATVQSVQLAVEAQAGMRMVNEWWFDLVLIAYLFCVAYFVREIEADCLEAHSDSCTISHSSDYADAVSVDGESAGECG